MQSVFVQTDTCQTCVRQPVSDSVGIRVRNAVGNPSVNVAKSRNFFATLCEIPTGYMLSVYPSVKRYIFLFFYVTLSKNLELQSYSTHNTITKADP
jgi:hypothetical protein